MPDAARFGGQEQAANEVGQFLLSRSEIRGYIHQLVFVRADDHHSGVGGVQGNAV